MDFPGGSVIVGPEGTISHAVTYYEGLVSQDKEELIIAKIDLSKAKRRVYQINPLTGTTDWRLDIDEKLLKNVKEKTGDKYISKPPVNF